MKRMIKKIIMFTTIFCAVFSFYQGIGYIEHSYTLECEICTVEKNYFEVVNHNGECYSFYADENKYKENQKVKVTFYDNNTTNIYDDEIVKVKSIS